MEDKARVRIDQSAGLVEVEGSEAFVREMVDRFANSVDRPAPPKVSQRAKKAAGRGISGASKDSPAAASKTTRPKRLEDNDDLRGRLRDHADDLNSYVSQRRISSLPEEATIIARFLGSELDIEAFDETHYITVLKTLGKPVPKTPRQVLLDAENKKHFLYKEGSGFRLSRAGAQFADVASLEGTPKDDA